MIHTYKFIKLLWLVVMVAIQGLVAAPALADGSVTVSGRVYNAATNTGYAGVSLYLCGGRTVKTDANGNWSATVAVQGAYCARITSGAPSGLPLSTHNNAEHASSTTYEDQLAGYNCYQQPACSVEYRGWDRISDTDVDFIYGTAPTPTPTPATPSPTPTSAPVTSTTEFTAQAKGQTSIGLVWSVVAGSTYTIERSTDEQVWQALALGSASGSFVDSGLLPGVRYYYRLQATTGGTAADYAYANTATQPASITASTNSYTVQKSNLAGPAPQWVQDAVYVAAGVAILVVLAFMPIPVGNKKNYRDYLWAKYSNF